MRRAASCLLGLCLLTVISAPGSAADAAKLSTLTGVVVKAEKESLQVRAAGDAKTARARTLRLTGTSKFTLLVPQMRNGKLVLTQRETTADALAAEQPIAIIYANVDGESIVLSAVVQTAN